MTKIQAVAMVLREAGFATMAREFRTVPRLRRDILQHPMLRRELTRTIGEQKTARFYELAKTVL